MKSVRSTTVTAGFAATNSYGPTTPGSGYATMDWPVNGRLCVPRPVGYLSWGYD